MYLLFWLGFWATLYSDEDLLLAYAQGYSLWYSGSQPYEVLGTKLTVQSKCLKPSLLCFSAPLWYAWFQFCSQIICFTKISTFGFHESLKRQELKLGHVSLKLFNQVLDSGTCRWILRWILLLLFTQVEGKIEIEKLTSLPKVSVSNRASIPKLHNLTSKSVL